MSDRSSNKETSPERSPWSRPSVLLSGAFLLALVLLGVVVAATGSGGGTNHPRGRRLRPPPAPHAVRERGAAAISGRESVGPVDSPPQAQWGTVGSMQVPQNPAVYGPQRSDGPWETCFAHNPSGALLAAMNLWAEGTAAPRARCSRAWRSARRRISATARGSTPAARSSSPATAMTPTPRRTLRW